MENLPHTFRETNFVLQLIQEFGIKSKTLMSWSSRKKKEGIFCTRLFCAKESFFNICVLSQCVVYWINFQNIYTFNYQNTLLHTLVFESVESLQCILKSCNIRSVMKKPTYFKYSEKTILFRSSKIMFGKCYSHKTMHKYNLL